MMVVDGGAKGGMISASAAKANSRQSDFGYDTICKRPTCYYIVRCVRNMYSLCQ